MGGGSGWQLSAKDEMRCSDEVRKGIKVCGMHLCVHNGHQLLKVIVSDGTGNSSVVCVCVWELSHIFCLGS